MPGIMEYHQSAICTKTMALVCGKDRCSNTSPHFTVGIAFTHGLQQEGCRWLFLCWTPAGFTQLTHHQMCRFCVLPCASDSVSERHICCWIMRGRPAIWHPPRWCEQPGPLGGCSSASTLSFPWVCIFYPPTKEKKKKPELEEFSCGSSSPLEQKISSCCIASAPKPRFSWKNVVFPSPWPVSPGLLKDEAPLGQILTAAKWKW